MCQFNKKKMLIVPVFIPHAGCPHQCVFCNQVAITGINKAPVNKETLRSIIDQFLQYNNKREKIQISFYGGTFLGLPDDQIKMLLSEADIYVKAGQVNSIRFSTRPDTINERQIKLIQKYPVETIEIGTQSMNNMVLNKSGRGHSAEDTEHAVKILKKYGYETGLQIMAGLPADTDTTLLATTEKVIELKPDFVRIYPTIVLKGSQLEKMFLKGKYSPLNLDKCVLLVKTMYLHFLKNNIPVIRMGLQSSFDFESGDEIVAGPYHPAFGHLVFSSIFLDMAVLAIEKSKTKDKHLIFHVNPRDISKIRGLKNNNISVLMKKFNLEKIEIIPENSLELNSVKIGNIVVDITSLYKIL